MSDDLSHRLSSIADEMERAARGKSAEDLHELFARACVVMREGAEAIRRFERPVTITMTKEMVEAMVREGFNPVGHIQIVRG